MLDHTSGPRTVWRTLSYLLLAGLVSACSQGSPTGDRAEHALESYALASGAEEAWTEHVDQLLQDRIRQEDDWVSADLTDDFETHSSRSYFRGDVGVTVICDTSLNQMLVVFDIQSEANLIVVIGAMGVERLADEPDVEVSWRSAEGAELRERLCRRVRDHLQRHYTAGPIALTTTGDPLGTTISPDIETPENVNEPGR